jgi:hypothetical protein
LIVVLAGLCWFFVMNQFGTYEKSMQNRAEYLIKVIDRHKKETGKIPDSLLEIMDDKQYNTIFILEPKDNNQYILRFKMRNNCDKIYQSEQQIWSVSCY